MWMVCNNIYIYKRNNTNKNKYLDILWGVITLMFHLIYYEIV